jgi:hypothetical protein
MGAPHEAQMGTLPPSPVFTTASPSLPLTAPTPVGLGGAPPRGAGGAWGGGATLGVKGLAGGALPPPCPGVQTPGFGAVI